MPNRLVGAVVGSQELITAGVEATVIDAVRMMKQRRVGAVLVVDGTGLVGIFTERDALVRVLADERDPRTTRLAEVMTSNPQTIGADKPFAHALHMMYEGGFRHVPVVEAGRPIGIVSARDMLGPEIDEFEADLRRRERIGEIIG